MAIEYNTLDFLTLNDLVDEIVHFALSNDYQNPKPTPIFIDEFSCAMKELFVIYEQIRVMPEYSPKASLEALSRNYSLTYDGLSKLMMACPDPDEALGWFDYRKQYKSRALQLKRITVLLDWHQSIYMVFVNLVPELPVPWIAAESFNLSNTENSEQRTNSAQTETHTVIEETTKLFL
ncbi:hypothetical protein D210916BOD24_11060 [Alteromonas sp. D210916BOD_24]|uniref:hypothetical protein n=1 Tax=Alteromonas sp. D210916BOD_24 TaxID=3157618 RepID=UPI00399CA068